MGRIWIPRESGKYWLPKQRFLTVYHHCLQYPEWKVEINVLRASLGISGVNYDGMPHGNGTSDPTSSAAIRLADLDGKMHKLEDTVREAAPDIYRFGISMIRKACRSSVTLTTSAAAGATISWRRNCKVPTSREVKP